MLGVVADDCVLEHGLAGVRLAEDQAEPALLAVDLESVEVALLVFEQRSVLVDGEGLAGNSEVASDHGGGWVGCRFVGGYVFKTRSRAGGRWRRGRGGCPKPRKLAIIQCLHRRTRKKSADLIRNP